VLHTSPSLGTLRPRAATAGYVFLSSVCGSILENRAGSWSGKNKRWSLRASIAANGVSDTYKGKAPEGREL